MVINADSDSVVEPIATTSVNKHSLTLRGLEKRFIENAKNNSIASHIKQPIKTLRLDANVIGSEMLIYLSVSLIALRLPSADFTSQCLNLVNMMMQALADQQSKFDVWMYKRIQKDLTDESILPCTLPDAPAYETYYIRSVHFL
ncbi:MAG: hypothetical protein ACTXOO_01420 [Sodalis sp. (in: enterobacteria)]